MKTDTRIVNSSTAFLFALFFVSGATTLIYEISWTRQLGLLFGHTVLAGSVVLASLFLGLAVGYGFGGRLSASTKTLRWFGFCEIAAAVWTICVPTILKLLHSPAILQWISSEHWIWQGFSRAVIGILLTLPATVAIGATLPLMSELLTRVSKHGTPAATVGYAWNTAGAMFGTLVCTYWLLVQIGVTRSSYLSACVAMLAGIVAIVLSRQFENRPANTSSQVRSGQRLENSPRRSVVLAIAAISGFVTLALEILYTRLFSLVFHNSTYTFGNVVAVFLMALAVGAAIVAVMLRRTKAETILFWCGISGAISSCLFLAIFVNVTRLNYFLPGETFIGHLMRGFGLVLAFVMVPVTLCGMIFPATWQILARNNSTGRVIGLLAMANAVGAALGSLAASFVMLPTIGLWAGFLVAASLLFVIAILASAFVFTKRRAIAIALAVSCIVAAWLSTDSWSLMGRDRDEVFLTRRESAYGWIDVTRNEDGDAWYIRQNLHYRLGGTGSEAMRERRQARLPMLLHPNPERLLLLGMGTGVTAAGAIQHPETKAIEIVELIADVTAAARELGHRNDYVLENDRVHVTTDDARHFLLGTDQLFDVILSDLFVPWESETGYLYTREHYKAASERLKTGGLFCQWLPVYQTGEREFTMIADTFASVFPETALWWGQLDPSKPIIGLVGSMHPIELDESALAARLAILRRVSGGDDRELAAVNDLRLASIGDWRVTNADLLNLDEHPRVEFWSPQSLMAGNLLRGAWFAKFYDDVLANLPPANVNNDSGSFFGNADQIRSDRQSRRFILFGE